MHKINAIGILYNHAQNCDRINLVVKKGEKDRLKAHASGRGESLNAFIVRAIRETLERDGEEGR